MAIWTVDVGDAGSSVLRYRLCYDSVCATYSQAVDAWRTDPQFCTWFNALLAAVPFRSFRWETPGG